jgi:hypothetical protein
MYIANTYLNAASALLLLTVILTFLWFAILVSIHAKKNRMREHWDKTAAKNTDGSMWEQVKQAESPEELLFWIQGEGKGWLCDQRSVRSILCYAESRFSTPEKLDTRVIYYMDSGMRPLAKYLLLVLDEHPRLESGAN